MARNEDTMADGESNTGTDERLITTDVTAGLDEGSAAATDSSRTVIDARNVDFYYDDVQALNDVSLSIPEGEVTAMIGPSGIDSDTSSSAWTSS